VTDTSKQQKSYVLILIFQSLQQKKMTMPATLEA